MELVYFWIEDYKNIKNQGFNFSPRFSCDYDKDKNRLVIKENKNYRALFPRNINVTAIIGQNGSGKSSIIASIINGIILNEKTEYKRNVPLVCFLSRDKKEIYVLSYYINTAKQVTSEVGFKLTHYASDNFSDKLSSLYENTPFGKMKILSSFKKEYYRSFFYLYDNSLKIDANFNRTYEYNEELLFFSEINKTNNVVDLGKENNKIYNYLMSLLLNQHRIPKGVEKFFKPTSLFLDREILMPYFIDYEQELRYHSFLRGSPRPKIEDTLKLETLLYLKYFIQNFDVLSHEYMKKEIESLYAEKDIVESYEQVYSEMVVVSRGYLVKIISTKKSIRYDDNKHNDSYLKQLNELENVFYLICELNSLLSIIKMANNDPNYPDYELDTGLLDDKKLLLLKKLPLYLKVNFANETGRRFEELSSGEQNLLKLMYSVENIMQLRKEKTDSLYVLLDEIEVTFHPDWQKKIMNWLLEFIGHYDMQVNIIIASHSPFVISDIPKENIIFLKEGKQNYPFRESEQTFGANIHKLLAHGFFMEDGLIGEFAKTQIARVVNLLKSKRKLSKKDEIFCENIIAIIGESLLQKTLLSQFNQKLNQRENEIERLEKTQKEIQAKIDRLKGGIDDKN